MLLGWILLMIGVVIGQLTLVFVQKRKETLLLPTLATLLYVGMLHFGWDFGAFATALLLLTVSLWILSIWTFFK